MASYNEIFLGYFWLNQQLTADSTLMGYLPSGAAGICRDLAGDGIQPPYVILAKQAATDVNTLNAYRLMSSILYQVKVVGPASMTDTLMLAAVEIDRILGGPPSLPASGPIIIQAVQVGYVLSMYREQPLQTGELVNGKLWNNIGGLYRALIEQIAS